MELTISEMAEMVDVSPNTLRNWEERGLITPERTKGNQRIYKKKDYYTILYILYLNKERKIALDDIPSRLNNSETSDFLVKSLWTDSKLSDIDWRALRLKEQWTLEEVAQKSEISISYLSKIENGAKNISLNVLDKLAEVYKLNLEPLYSNVSFNNTVVINRDERPQVNSEVKDVKIEKIGQTLNGESLIMHYELRPDAEREKFHDHEGFEIVYVESGSIVFFIEDKEYSLSKGDSIQFESNRKHRYKNLSQTTTLVWTFFGK